MVYFVFQSPHINRLFTEDYIDIFRESDFKVQTIELKFLLPMSDDLEKRINTVEQLYSGRKHFRNNGILAVLKKTK